MRAQWCWVAAAALVAQGALAAERGTPAEARAMLAKAVAHYAAAGRQQALSDFNTRKAGFFDRDLYVVCLGPDHTIAAHGAFPNFVGQNVDVLKDADGKPLGKALWDAAGQAEGVRYRVMNPVSGKTEPKVSYAQKAGSDVCLVGAFNAP